MAGACPHDSAKLGDEIRGSGIGVTRVCETCGHIWYLNRKIRTCRCLNCSADKRKAKGVADDLDDADVKTYNHTCASNERAGVAESADAADLKTAFASNDASALIEAFINSRRDGLSPRSIKNYRLYLRLSSEVVGLNVTGLDVQRFITSRRCSNGGKHAYYRCLKTFYNWLYSPKSGLGLKIYDNPILAVDAPKVEKKILPSLTTEQVELLIDQAECTRDKAIISLFADSGLRLVELANIDPHNIDWENRLIKVKCKGNKEGYAPFGEHTDSLLREWLSKYKADGRLWNLNHNAIYDMLRKLRTDTGLPCNPHSFRRTFASILAKRGVDSLHIIRLGRWESMAMVERYTRSVKFEDSLKLYSDIVR